MAYVQRDQHGNITAVFDSPQQNAQESVSINSEELISFLRDSEDTEHVRVALSSSDMALVRVLEDLVNTLIDKNVILFTDLPMAAREKLSNREKIRGHLNSLDDLMGDDHGIL
ncbi:hypothetical protein LP43_1757 [Methylophaga thiooxydans]|uniref:Tryptophan synthase subunit beta like protein n=1 Tax=Methylophaga thiooxydans TaxID=392484 RepID=A0A0A0BF71_9GAMM|nr:hypothetical protein [Methylophaga thiooxydans]KGM06535.1 hypothetical protein LP43_1757 [Methylophaga thiooxydans]